MKLVLRAGFLISVLILSTSTLFAQIVSDFSVNDEGWTIADPFNGNSQTVIYNSTGGNPGGYVSFTTTASTSLYWRAPAKFLGGHCLDSYGLNLKFDLQISAAGTITSTFVSYGALRLTNAAGSMIVVDITPAPQVTPGWTKYSIRLDETTTWRNNTIIGTIATHADILNVLTNLAKIEIVGQAYTATDPEVRLDNVILEQSSLGIPPTITSISPQFGVPSVTNVTINGTNFNTSTSGNAVYFGGVQANVSAASATQLTVKVPVGAALSGLTVVDLATGLSATSTSFQPRFDNNKDYGGQIIRASLAPYVAVPLTSYGGWIEAADIDGDGKNDIVVSESTIQKFEVMRNVGPVGSITAASFAAPVGFSVGTTSSKGYLGLGDFDGDGKIDVAVSSASAAASVSVFRNTSTPGTISFSGPLILTGYSYSDGPLAVADMDGDGRPEILSVFNNACGTGTLLYIFPNRSTPGAIDFCAYTNFGPVYTCGGNIGIADFNGDKKPDVVVDASAVTIFQNNSSPGVLAMATPFVLASGAAGKPALADFDGDSKVDIAWQTGTTKVEIHRNIYAGGALDATSFSAAVLVEASMNYSADLAVADFNSDGKIDILSCNHEDFAILQNLSTPGSITPSSFLPGVPFRSSNSGFVSPKVADFDGDGKPDFFMRVSNFTLPAASWVAYVYHNESYPVPRIDAIAPGAGTTGASVTMTGDYLNTNGGTPSVRISEHLLSSAVSSNTTATTTISTGSHTGQITATEHGLTGYNSKPFSFSFNTARVINASSFATGVDFTLPGTPPACLLVSDFDDDGKSDVVVGDGTAMRLYRNTHATAGQPVTTASLTNSAVTINLSYNAIAFDIDGDGKIDINNGYGLLKNTSSSGTLSFTDTPGGIYTYASGFTSAATADFNKDGKMDIAISTNGPDIRIYPNTSNMEPFVNNGPLSPLNPTYIALTGSGNSGGVVTADFDGDGYDDVATVHSPANEVMVYLNLALYGPVVAASFAAGVSFTTLSQPVDLAVADFDGDGKIDIAVTHNNAAFVSVYRNVSTSGSVAFATPVNLTSLNKGLSIKAADLDGDGLAEIVVAHRPNPGPGSFTVFQNTSTSGVIGFGTGINTALARNPTVVNITDVNGDNKPDILIIADQYATSGHALTVFENKIANGNTITITTQPSDNSVCVGGTGQFHTNATGTTNITYQWQFATTSAGPFADIADGPNYSGTATKDLTINTTGSFGAGRYRARVSGDIALPVFTADEGLFLNPTPAAPTTTGATTCTPGSVVLTASGGSNGNYRWYTLASGGSAIGGEVNSTYTTPAISATTTYYVSVISAASCESSRTAVVATFGGAGCPTNSPPVIATTTESTYIGGAVSIDLTTLLSDPDGNLDLSTLTIVQQPSSGAVATIDASYRLSVNYQGVTFSGIDRLTIGVCDVKAACTQEEIEIQVSGSVVVYNAVSPNGDGKNDGFILEFIDAIPTTAQNTVTIYNRWGHEVFAVSDYNNTTRVFNGTSSDGKQLPSGTYFYKITFPSGSRTMSGYLELKW